MSATDQLADDPIDPIPRVDVVDVISELDNGDLLCGLIIARPMSFSDRSMARLVRKVDTYIRHLEDRAKLHNVRVDFVVHPECDADTMRAVKACGARLLRHSIQFTIETHDPDQLPDFPTGRH